MPALRESLKRGRKFWTLITAAVALAAAAAFDWTRPPEQQRSVGFYETVIVAPYQRFVSPVASKVVHCRYTPTCSEYSAAAVRTHGFPRGLWLTTKRIFRCRPGVPLRTRDPVPPATAQLNRDVIDPSHRC